MNVPNMSYPWYCLVSGDELEQEDILESCPVFSPPSNLTLNSLEVGEADFAWEERDVIIMSQSCDLVKGREKIKEVLFCTVWSRSELETLPGGDLSAKKRFGNRFGKDSAQPSMYLTSVNCRMQKASSELLTFAALTHFL